MTLDYRAYPVLYVDDESQNLVAFRYAMEDQFGVLTASGGEQALEILRAQEVAVLLTDQRMPGMNGVQLCEAAQRLRPDTIRIIVTAYADLHSAIDAINSGQISRYMVKPWRNDELSDVLRTAIELVHVQRAVHDMELRLLRSGQTLTAVSTRAALLHEINNPLGALLASLHHASWMTAQIRERLDKTAEQSPELKSTLSGELDKLQDVQEAQGDALLAVEQLRRVVGRLRGSDSIPPPPGICDAARVIDATVRILRRELERAAQIEVVLSEAPLVAIDAAALGQVLLNLLLNAAQAIEGAGLEARSIEVRVAAENQQVMVSVVDTGPGIAPERLAQIFEPYFTTRSGGSGLGLSIVRELTERAGGKVSAHSQLGQGTTIEVRLPLAR